MFSVGDRVRVLSTRGTFSALMYGGLECEIREIDHVAYDAKVRFDDDSIDYINMLNLELVTPAPLSTRVIEGVLMPDATNHSWLIGDTDLDDVLNGTDDCEIGDTVRITVEVIKKAR